MLTLDEAIQHCAEKEQEQALNGCFTCAEEHAQLALWLKQFRTIREAYMTGEVFNLMAACMEAFGEVTGE